MNLIEVLRNLRISKSKLKLNAEKRNDNNYRIYNWLEFSNTLNLLKDFSFLEDQVDYIFSIDDNINIRNFEWIASQSTYSKMDNGINTLKDSIDSCIKLIEEYTLESINIPEGSGMLNVKMPNDIDMKSMSSICDDLDIVFEQCPLIEEEVKFIGVEKGSVLFVFITTIVSIKTIGALLNTALDIQKKFYQNQMLKSKLETINKVESSTNEIIKILDEEVDAYCKTKAMEIEGAADLEPEEKTRLILSIKTLYELIGKGVQMQFSLSEGEDNAEISNFPSLEDFKNILETIKLIE